MHRPGEAILLWALSFVLCGSGCASFVQPYDELAVWLDRYPFDSTTGSGPSRAAIAVRRRPPVRLVQYEQEIPEPRPDAVPTPVSEANDGLAARGAAAEPLITGPELGKPLPASARSPVGPTHSIALGSRGDDGMACGATSHCGCRIGEFCPYCPMQRLLMGDCCLADCPLLHPPPPGPPPVRYQPPMPPEFLLVPTEPVLAPGRTGPVELSRGNVRSGFGPQFTVMGRD